MLHIGPLRVQITYVLSIYLSIYHLNDPMLCLSDVRDVQVGVTDAPAGGEILLVVVLHVSLHGDQAAAELTAHVALVGRSPAVGPQVLDHGRVVT